MAIQLEYVKVAKYEKDYSCSYNTELRCGKKECYRCGWNPKVEKARLEKIQKERAEVNDG